MSCKRLLNTTDACVDDALEGLVAVNPGIAQLKGHRVILREDTGNAKQRSNQVALLSGGGSGHEPAHAGYVGRGMLTGAIAGSVFTSPPTKSILEAIRAVGTGNSAGTLLIVKSYTGDRLNFGIAAEKAKAEGLKVEMVVIGEDCALSSVNKMAGKRGLCGTVLIHKIAGALAEEGRSLDEIVTIVTKAAKQMGTISVSLSPCAIPGSGPSFVLKADEMELGLGIHGEAGIKRMKLLPAKETVAVMMDHMTHPDNSSHLPVTSGDHVVLVVNNLGGTSYLELNIMAKEAIAYLESKSVCIERVYCGTFMTSLDMAGVSITVMCLDENGKLVQYLDRETTAPAWPRVFTHPRSGGAKHDLTLPLVHASEKMQDGDADEFHNLYQALKAACEAVIMKENHLNELDRGCGDGDTGTTLKRGAEGVMSWLSTQKQPLSSSTVAMQVALIAEDVMGGSSGALYSIFFTAAGRVLQSPNNLQNFCDALKEGIDSIMKYGGAEVGDRTMLDPLYAVYEVLSRGDHTGNYITAAAKAAEEMAERTSSMVARAGRASYVSSEHLTRPDPGAFAVAVWVRAVANSLSCS